MRLMHWSKLLVTSMSQPCLCRFLSGASSTCEQPKTECLFSVWGDSSATGRNLPQQSHQHSQQSQQLLPELRSCPPSRRSQRHDLAGRRSPGTSGLHSARSATRRTTSNQNDEQNATLKSVLMCLFIFTNQCPVNDSLRTNVAITACRHLTVPMWRSRSYSTAASQDESEIFRNSHRHTNSKHLLILIPGGVVWDNLIMKKAVSVSSVVVLLYHNTVLLLPCRW